MNQYTKREASKIFSQITGEEIRITEVLNVYSFEYGSKTFHVNKRTLSVTKSTNKICGTSRLLNNLIEGYKRAATKQFLNS